MNTAKWNNMNRANRKQAIQCPCEGGIQNIELEHVVSECAYMEEWVTEMIITVGEALQSTTKAAECRPTW